MNRFIKFLLALQTAFFCSVCYSAPESSGQIQTFYINSSGQVLFRLGNTASLPPECSDQSWPYQFSVTDLSANAWISMLLAAKATNELVRIGYNPVQGTNRCNVIYLFYLM